MTTRPDAVPPWIGKRIKHLRTERQWTLQDLSRRCGLSKSGISKIEAGNDFTVSSAIAIAEAFGMPVTDLLASPVCGHCDGKPPAGFLCPECGRKGEG